MKIPKAVNICGKIYSVSRNSRQSIGGRGSTGKQTIEIATKNNKPERALENLVHEIAELIMVERGFRYDADDDGRNIRFVMDHPQFDIFASDLSATLLPMIKD